MAILETLLENDIVLGSSTLPLLLGVIALLIFSAWLIVFVFFIYKYYLRMFIRFTASHKKQLELGAYKKTKALVGRHDLKPYLGRIDTLTLKSKGQSPDKYMDELYHLVREFCIELLGIGHTYSDDELIALLTDDARDLARFHWHIVELKSHRGIVSKEKFESLLSTFFVIVSTHTKEKPGLAAFSRNILSRFIKVFENKKLSAEESQIEQLLFREKQVFEYNLLSVKDACTKILDSYSKLPHDERVSLYPELISFYHTAIDNLSSSVYGSKAKTELKFFPNELVRIRNSGKESIVNKLSKYFGPEMPAVSREAIDLKKTLQPALPAKFKEEPRPVKIPRAPKPLPQPKPLPAPKPLPIPKEGPKPVHVSKPMPAPKPVFNEPEEDPEIVRLRNAINELEPGLIKMPKNQVIQKPKPLPIPKPLPAPEPLPALSIPKAPKPVQKVVEKPEGKAEKRLNELMASRMRKIDYVSRIHELVAKARKLIVDKKIRAAKSAYETIKNNFLLLNDGEKRIVYPAVSGLYADLLKAMHEHPKDIKVDLKTDLENQEQKLKMLLGRMR